VWDQGVAAASHSVGAHRPIGLPAVKRSFVAMKDVDNDLQIIEHDPLTGRKPVNRHGRMEWSSRKRVSISVRDCFELRLRCSRAKHEKIRERRDRAQVEDDNIFRLFIEASSAQVLAKFSGVISVAPGKFFAANDFFHCRRYEISNRPTVGNSLSDFSC
jgi:hypothetical protein